jgi:CHASE1-domain containing sensor protein
MFSKFSQVLLLSSLGTLGVLLTGLGYHRSSTNEKINTIKDFELLSKQVNYLIEKEINIDLQHLLAIKSFFYASDFISREEFKIYTDQLLENRASIQALSYIPYVSKSEKKSFEKNANSDGLLDFVIREKLGDSLIEVGIRDHYYPVYYIEPFEENKAAFGFDLSSNEVRNTAIIKARETGKNTATARVKLVQEKASQQAILIFCPRVQSDYKQGLISGVFRMDDLLSSALGSFDSRQFNVYLYDYSDPKEHQLLSQMVNDGALYASDVETISSELQHYEIINVADRKWKIVTTPGPAFSTDLSREPLLILILGSFITLVILIFIYRRIRTYNQKKSKDDKVIRNIIFRQEESKEGIAENLYEDLAQHLFIAKHLIDQQASKESDKDQQASEEYVAIQQMISNGLEISKRLATELMPRSLMKYGLITSLDLFVEGLKRRQTEFICEIDDDAILFSKEVQITIYKTLIDIIYVSKNSLMTRMVLNEFNDEININITISGFSNGQQIELELEQARKRIELETGRAHYHLIREGIIEFKIMLKNAPYSA